MFLLAQTPPDISIEQFLSAFVPFTQIVQIVNKVLPGFVLVGAMIVTIGYVINLVSSETGFSPTARLITLLACMSAAPWFLTIAQEIANTLVRWIGAADPQLNWLVVNNPGDASLAMDFSKPFGIIGQYVTGSPGPAPGTSLLELGKWPDYLMRAIVIALTGIAACVTVFLMEVMLVLQKLILVCGRPLLPIFIASLSLRAAQGSAQIFLKAVVGVTCWPIGWAIVHVGTMAALQLLKPPSWNAGLGELILTGIVLGVICLWMAVGTIGAPVWIARTVTRGTNFASDMMGNFASAAGQHAARGAEKGGAVAGALAGSLGGPSGAAIGAGLGSGAGSVAGSLITSATQSAEGVNGGRNAIPSSRSAGLADMAIKGIKSRA